MAWPRTSWHLRQLYRGGQSSARYVAPDRFALVPISTDESIMAFDPWLCYGCADIHFGAW